ncbi:MAG: hypothetical protein V4547_16405 [Bacteroidota bacterium]
MSWQDRIDNIKFSITTGDGKIFYPLLGNAEKSTDFNTSEFDYIDIEGTEIGRKKAKGGKFPLVFYFEGDDNIEQTEAFEKSAKDSRLWVVVHPFYGEIKGQPLSLGRNDSALNTTQVTVDFWESIDRKLPKSEVAVREQLTAMTVNQIGLASTSYASAQLKTSDLRKVKSNLEKTSARYENSVTNENFQKFKELKSNAEAAVDKLLTNPADAITQIGAYIQFATSIETSVVERVELLKHMYNDTLEIIEIVARLSDKLFFESVGSFVISAICNTSLFAKSGDYVTRNEIEEITAEISDIYSHYLLTIDAAQTNTVTDAFSPDFATQTNLNALVSATLVNLFNLAFDAKQERTVQVEKDTNLIILVHKYLGLDANDQNIESFRNINGIRNKNVFKIKQGRTIKYFV